jgi:ATP-dependent DNA ligase
MPRDVRLQIVTPCKRPPSVDGWLHEIKHDGHRLVAMLRGDGQLMLLSRNGYDRTKLFREPFGPLPDMQNVTHNLARSILAREGIAAVRRA